MTTIKKKLGKRLKLLMMIKQIRMKMNNKNNSSSTHPTPTLRKNLNRSNNN